jgi:hypothetical protein
MTIRRFASAADADREDHAYWQQIPEAERALEVWRLSQELWRLKGGPPHEPRILSICCARSSALTSDS